MRSVTLVRRYLPLLVLLGCCGALTKLIAAPSQLIEVQGADAKDFSLCALMSEPAIDGTLVNSLIATAQRDLLTKNIKARYRPVRAVDGPKSGEVSILFASLTYSDIYEVYVGSKETGRIARTYGQSGFEYPLAGCG